VLVGAPYPRPHKRAAPRGPMKVTEGGKTYNVVIVGSPNVNPGYKLVHNDSYPQIAQDYQRMFDVMKGLALRYFPGGPRRLFRVGKRNTRTWKREEGGLKAAPTIQRGTMLALRTRFIDPDGYKKFVAEKEQEFHAELAKPNQRRQIIRGGLLRRSWFQLWTVDCRLSTAFISGSRLGRSRPAFVAGIFVEAVPDLPGHFFLPPRHS